MGRDRKNEDRSEHWTKLTRSLIEEPAWRALSSAAQALYPWLRLEWRGPQSNNNGALQLSVRQAAEKMGVSINTASRAYHDLQAKGFLVVVKPTQLGIGGSAKSPEFELTEIELPHRSKRGGRQLYQTWQKGCDFAVNKAAVHNPAGRNSKAEPYHQNSDSTVIKMVTSR